MRIEIHMCCQFSLTTFMVWSEGTILCTST